MTKPLNKITKECSTCRKVFTVHRYRAETSKFCSHTCKRLSPESKRLVSLHNAQRVLKEEKSPQWKGDDVGYSGKHKWVARQLGKPSLCKHCGTTEAKKYEWANISKEYKRDLTDWVRLCVSCHRLFDGHMRKAWRTRRAVYA